jgi:hypothetical protein
MGIDRIGKPGPPAAPPVTTGAPSPGARAEGGTFGERVSETRAAREAGAPSGALEKLQAGAIDLEGYLDIKVHEATAQIAGLAPARVEAIRSALRERLSSDPTLADLVRKATEAVDVPSPSHEE